jgi:hypothetical protein
MIKMFKVFFNSVVLFVTPFASAVILAQPYYVSTSGADGNAGTISSPFLTITKAVSMVSAGQTIYVRGGTYNLTSTITISKSGTANAYINLLAYQNERPVLNFSGEAFGSKGIKLSGSYWHIKGIDITMAGDNGMNIAGGNYNVIEFCSFYRNNDSGLQLDSGSAYDTVLNCDSFFNADPTDYGDADGFAVKMAVGTGNYFSGCRSWRNCDDGWDGYLRGTDDVSTTLVNCWAFENGYFENGNDPGANANGNGFKMGGSDDKTLKHNFTLEQCLSFNNKAKGFDQNNNKGSMTLYNCSGYNNIVANYRITATLAAGKTLIVKNCLDLNNDAEIGSFATQEKNSWLMFAINSSDFVSVTPDGVTGARKSDGSLPDITYMHLVPGDRMIDAGVNVGLPYAGTAPDLGCFETALTGIDDLYSPNKAECYPNPAGNTVILHMSLAKGGHCEVSLFDVSGRFVKMIVDEKIDSGEQYRTIDLSDLKNGLFLYSISLNGTKIESGKLIRQVNP